MPHNVLLVDAHGKPQTDAIVDSRGSLHDLRAIVSEPFRVIGHIDPYGDTVFNRPQMEPFLDDWAKLRAAVKDPAAGVFLDAVEKLARRCAAEVHLYLKFVGD